MLRKKQPTESHQQDAYLSNLHTITGIALAVFGVIVVAVSLSCYFFEHHKYRKRWRDYDDCGFA